MQRSISAKPFAKTLSSILFSVSLLTASSIASANTSWNEASLGGVSSPASTIGTSLGTVAAKPGKVQWRVASRPASLKVTEGESASFYVDASMSDGSEISYQWLFNDQPIVGATDNMLSIDQVSLENQGVYRVQLTSAKGTKSFRANLKVKVIPAKLTVSERPVSQSVVEGQSASFYVNASMSDNSDIRYQWLFNDQPIAGATDNMFSIDSASMSNQGVYKVQLVSSKGTKSFRANLKVKALPAELIVLNRPADLSVLEGQNASLYIDARMSDNSEIRYQWMFNGQAISGATDNMLYMNQVSLADQGSYQVKVSSARGTKYFDASLTVEALPAELIVAKRPVNLSMTEGEQASFYVDAHMSDDSAIRFQWLFNGQVMNGANDNMLAINPVILSDQGKYSVQVISSAGTQYFEASLAVKAAEPVSDMSIIDQPNGIAGKEGGQQSMTIYVSSSRELTYQWRKDGVNLGGQTSASLNFSSLNLDDAGQYEVSVSDGLVTLISQKVDVTVERLLDKTIQLSWDMPAEREDGSYLSPEEISGYQIYLELAEAMIKETLLVSADTLSLELNDMPSGNYRFAIATIDADGAEGAASEWVSLQIN